MPKAKPFNPPQNVESPCTFLSHSPQETLPEQVEQPPYCRSPRCLSLFRRARSPSNSASFILIRENQGKRSTRRPKNSDKTGITSVTNVEVQHLILKIVPGNASTIDHWIRYGQPCLAWHLMVQIHVKTLRFTVKANWSLILVSSHQDYRPLPTDWGSIKRKEPTDNCSINSAAVHTLCRLPVYLLQSNTIHSRSCTVDTRPPLAAATAKL